MDRYIGIDIGGTNTKIALVNQQGEYTSLGRVYYNTADLSIDSFLTELNDAVINLVKLTQDSLKGIGISCPGIQMLNGHGTLLSANIPILNKFDLKKSFEDRYKVPVTVINDLVSHGLAESYFGLGKGVDRFLSVSLGTGIGHAYIYQGKPVFSINGISGDSARMIIDPNSEITDQCGISGSAEALCGVKAIEILGSICYSNGCNFTAKEIITKAREECDPIAIEVMLTISRRLALLLINLSSIYFPEVISITGGQTEAGSFFVEECQKEFDRKALSFFNDIADAVGSKRKLRIIKSSAGGLSGLIGSIVPLLY